MFEVLFIVCIVSFFTLAAFAHSRDESYKELSTSIDKLYNYISNEKRERDFLYGELEDKEKECEKLREKIEVLLKDE